jgi:DNA repair protein RadA/Sms
MAQGQEILYVSGEESLRQIKLRSQRLKVKGEGLSLFAETNIDQVETTIISSQPTIVMVDSIQTMVSDDITSAAGSVSQVREVTTRLMRLAKHMNIAIFIVGHVTKEGAIAGPRVLEHMVDTVLYFEGDKSASYRLLRAVKNRFGSTNEIGVFEMTDKGLVQVLNPSEYMLTGRPINEPGSVVICGLEGSRPLFIEGQALLTTTSFNMPRRTANGVDYNRLLMLLAVVEKKVDFTVNTQDSYVNIAGGIKLNEPALDLGIVAAILSSFYEKAVNPQAVFMGEVGLTGEVRGITFCQDRVKEAKKLGFEVCYVPQANLRHLSKIKGIQVVGISNIRQLKTEIF